MSLPILEGRREPDNDCLKCGMYKLCESPIMEGEGPRSPTFMWVGEAPGGEEDESDKPFIGAAGLLLRDHIENGKIPIKKCRFSNVVRCRPPDNDLKAFPHAIDHCRPHILREIHLANPKVVVLLGNSAIQSVLNRKGITKLHGEVFRGHGRYYICCLHPAWFLRNMHQIKKLADVIVLARRLGNPKLKEKPRKHTLITDRETLHEYVDFWKKQKFLATDIEGAGLNPYDPQVEPRIACTGFAWNSTEAATIPIHCQNGTKIHFSPEEGLEAMKEVWESDTKFIMHYGKYDYVYSGVVHDIWMKHYWFDTGMASYTLDERKGYHGLKDWAYRLGMGGYEQPWREYKRIHPECDPSKEKGDVCRAPISVLGPYNMDDCIATWKLFERLFKKLKEEDLYRRPFRFPIMHHNWTASMMEVAGLCLSLDRNEELLHSFPARIVKFDKKISEFGYYHDLLKLKRVWLMKKLHNRVKAYKREVPSVKEKVLELYHRELEKLRKKGKGLINLGSPDDKRILVYNIMGYEPISETSKGLPTADKGTLEALLAERPNKLLKLLVSRSAYQSSFNKYINPIRSWAGSDGRTHTTYKPAGQVTGRVGSENPNHENLPKRGKLAMELRNQFCASIITNPKHALDKFLLASADEKQIEMRLFADRANDDKMIEEFLQGKDPHRMGASTGFGVPEEKVTKEQRTFAKSAISFGLLYGRAAKALARDMGWSIRRAQRFIDRYFGKYDDCLEYRYAVEEFVRAHGFVMSYFGRIRRLPGIYSEDEATTAEAIRQAVNSPIQGDASDITWSAGYRLTRWLQKYRMKSKLVIAIHDDLTVDTYIPELQDVIEHLQKFMTDRKWVEKMTGWYCKVPFAIDISLGPNLGSQKELEFKKDHFVIPTEYRPNLIAA